jgi:hypothetical protein
MPDDIAVAAPPPIVPSGGGDATRSRFHLIQRMESATIGVRAADGSVAVRRGDPAGCFLYGPYLHLPQGRYRLRFRCRAGTPRLTAQPVLGVEVIVLSRFQEEWRDFTVAELADGMGSVDFTVSPEHSLESENEGRFEFRFFHLGNADLLATEIDLETQAPDQPPAPRRWRLLGRLRKSWLGRRADDGSVRVGRIEPAGILLFGGWPYLRLPGGHYRVLLDIRAGRPHWPDQPVLAIEVLGASRWRSRRRLMTLARWPETNGMRLAQHDITAAEAAAGPIAVDFAVPSEMALEAGADAPFDIRLRHLGNAALDIRSVDIVKLDAEAASPVCAAPNLRPSGRRRIVIIGNCQSETLRQGFAQIESLNRRFDARYHFVQLQKNLHQFAARDLEACDVLLIQDIGLWDQFPLRHCVRPGAEVHRFPLVRFASLWPFDAWNGPGDRAAFEQEAPNLAFPYLDGLLGRLRKEIPDREARFAAYRALALPEGLPGIVNYRRLHQLEVRRLEAMDQKFAVAIGGFILENFRERRLFHTTVRPNWEVFSLMMQFVAKAVGVSEPIALTESVDASLRNPQVPIHPKVARDLGVKWIHDGTHYLNRGREITWENYIRSYIDHYG